MVVHTVCLAHALYRTYSFNYILKYILLYQNTFIYFFISLVFQTRTNKYIYYQMKDLILAFEQKLYGLNNRTHASMSLTHSIMNETLEGKIAFRH